MNLDDLTHFAEKLALEAGALIAHARNQGEVDQAYKGQHELVTSADIAADKLIVETIQSRFPDHRILSEETFTDRKQLENLKDPIWIIDPIDGTVNFAHGQLMVAVSIALAFDGEVQLGVVHNPFLNETYVAKRGQGATLNHNTLHVSGQDNLRKAVIATGFPYDKSTLDPIIRRTHAVLKVCQDIRRLGSAAMDICWVACGRLDGYFESLSPWDFAAARLIALEAGARCGHFTEVPPGIPDCIYDQNLLITSPKLFEPLQTLLASHTDE